MSTKKQDDGLTEQSRRFIEAAREIGTDEDPKAFKRRLKQLTSAPQSSEADFTKDKKGRRSKT